MSDSIWMKSWCYSQPTSSLKHLQSYPQPPSQMSDHLGYAAVSLKGKLPETGLACLSRRQSLVSRHREAHRDTIPLKARKCTNPALHQSQKGRERILSELWVSLQKTCLWCVHFLSRCLLLIISDVEVNIFSLRIQGKCAIFFTQIYVYTFHVIVRFFDICSLIYIIYFLSLSRFCLITLFSEPFHNCTCFLSLLFPMFLCVCCCVYFSQSGRQRAVWS